MKNSEIKEVLIDIRDNRLGYAGDYICTCFKLPEEEAALKFFERNKPSEKKFKKFTKHQYWKDGLAWWHMARLNHEERKEVFKEKKRFLTALIETL